MDFLKDEYTARELEEAVGITRKALRVYVEKGLIEYYLNERGWWMFDTEAYVKLITISILKELGWSLERIALHFESEMTDDPFVGLEKIDQIIEELEQKKKKIESYIEAFKFSREFFREDTEEKFLWSIDKVLPMLDDMSVKDFIGQIEEADANETRHSQYATRIGYEIEKLVSLKGSGLRDGIRECSITLFKEFTNLFKYTVEERGLEVGFLIKPTYEDYLSDIKALSNLLGFIKLLLFPENDSTKVFLSYLELSEEAVNNIDYVFDQIKQSIQEEYNTHRRVDSEN